MALVALALNDLEAKPYPWCVLITECYLFVSEGARCNELPQGSWLIPQGMISVWGLTVGLCP